MQCDPYEEVPIAYDKEMCCNCAREHAEWKSYNTKACQQCRARAAKAKKRADLQCIGQQADLGGCFGALLSCYRPKGLRVAPEEDASHAENASMLLLAASNNDEASLKLLLFKEVDLLVQNGQGLTALHLAAREGHVSVAKMLVAAGGLDLMSKLSHKWQDSPRLCHILWSHRGRAVAEGGTQLLD